VPGHGGSTLRGSGTVVAALPTPTGRSRVPPGSSAARVEAGYPPRASSGPRGHRDRKECLRRTRPGRGPERRTRRR